jgi:hypothetical protein
MRLKAWHLGILVALGTIACSDPPKAQGPRLLQQDDNEETAESEEEVVDRQPEPSATPTPTPAPPPVTPTPAPPRAAPAYPRAATDGECRLGNGLYCAGNGVDGDPGTLYRCTDGSVDTEKKCASACLYFADGTPDACAGDASECPFGSGLYCGGNGLSGDTKTLYRCTAGSVSVEQTCGGSCVNEAPGVNDRCD